MALTAKYLLATLWALWAAAATWYFMQALRQITYVTLADGRRRTRSLPLTFRLLLPLAPNLTPFFERPRFDTTRERIARHLVSSGFEELLKPSEFLALRVLVPLALGLLWGAAVGIVIHATPGRPGELVRQQQGLFYGVVLLSAVVQPGMWLRRMRAQRHGSIQRSLPFVLDLLTLSVEAGMDFMSGLQRIIDRRQLDALGEEMIRVLREIQVGRTRREALRDMSSRVDHPDIRAVVNALVQADEMGVSIGSMLRIQADTIRNRRFQRAEKLANEAPVKLLFPLIAFIFPAVFMILMGPVFLRLAQQGF